MGVSGAGACSLISAGTPLSCCPSLLLVLPLPAVCMPHEYVSHSNCYASFLVFLACSQCNSCSRDSQGFVRLFPYVLGSLTFILNWFHREMPCSCALCLPPAVHMLHGMMITLISHPQFPVYMIEIRVTLTPFLSNCPILVLLKVRWIFRSLAFSYMTIKASSEG